MFSDHLKKVKRFPQVNLFIVAGCLVIACRLAAMAMVANHQVQQAGVLDLQRATQIVALADCIQRSTGPTRHGCTDQLNRESSGQEPVQPKPAGDPGFAVKNVASIAAIADESVTSALPDLMRAGAAGSR